VPIDLDKLSPEERALAERMTRSSWHETQDSYRNRDLDGITALYAPDAISIPADHRAMYGHDEIRTWYAKRSGDYTTFIESEVDSVDIVGDLAIVVGVFRACRPAEEGVAGLDHGGRYLAVLKKIDGQWKMWRDMDTPSPDADKFYGKLARGW
jgi:uncharacterized protein (TIGR02246 family)